MVRLCSIESCGNRHDSNGYCGKHNMMWKRHGDPLYVPVHVTKLCSVKNCNEKHSGKGFCGKHYNKFKKYGDPLYVPDPEQTKKKQSDSQKEWLEKNGNPMTGRKQSDETKKKISVSNKGRIPPHKGTKGIMKPNSGSFKKGHGKGIKKSEEHRRKIRLGLEGKKHTEEHRRKNSEGQKKLYAGGYQHPMKGKTHTEESKKKMAKGQKKRTQSPGYRNPMKGRKQTEEHRRKNSEGHKGIYPSDETIAKMVAFNNTPERKQLQREIRAKQIFPRKFTTPHKILQGICKNGGIIFENEKLFDLGFKMHRVDIFIEPNICLEADGDRIHANPNPFVIPSKSSRTQPGFKADDVIFGVSKSRKKPLLAKDTWETDRKETKALKQLGNKVLRFWHSELETEPEKCRKKILKEIQKR